MLDNNEMELILLNARASLEFADMCVDDEMVELARRHLRGELTEEEVLEIIKVKVLKR